MYELDARGRFTFVNEAFIERSGDSEAELLGEHVSIGTDDAAIAPATFSQHLRKPQQTVFGSLPSTSPSTASLADGQSPGTAFATSPRSTNEDRLRHSRCTPRKRRILVSLEACR